MRTKVFLLSKERESEVTAKPNGMHNIPFGLAVTSDSLSFERRNTFVLKI